MDGSARLKEFVSRLALGVAGAGFMAMFTIGFLFGASFLVGGLVAATIIYPEVLSPIKSRLAEVFGTAATKSPINARQIALFLPIAVFANIGMILGIQYYRYLDFRHTCASITNDLIDFNDERRAHAPSRFAVHTQVDMEKQMKESDEYERETTTLFQKRFATRIQVACDRIRSYRTWNAGEEEFVCLNAAMGTGLYKPQAIEALSLEIDWQDWLMSRTALMQFFAGLLASVSLWLIFLTLKREAQPTLPPVEATPR